jgi:hypothetical protein
MKFTAPVSIRDKEPVNNLFGTKIADGTLQLTAHGAAYIATFVTEMSADTSPAG